MGASKFIRVMVMNCSWILGGVHVLGNVAGHFDADFDFEPHCNLHTNLKGTFSRNGCDGKFWKLRHPWTYASLPLQLASLTVNVLRDFCKQEGLRCPSKKADIVECIKKHLKL